MAHHMALRKLLFNENVLIIDIQFIVTSIILMKKIIQNLDSNKTHSHDNIIIRMLGVLSSELKKGNIVHVKMFSLVCSVFIIQ